MMYGLSFESMSQSETYLWMYPSGLDRTSSTSPSAITLPPATGDIKASCFSAVTEFSG